MIMLHRSYKLIVLFSFFIFPSLKICAQTQSDTASGKKQINSESSNGLFDNDDIMHVKLSGRLNELFTDRTQNIVYHPLLLQYQ